MKGILLLCLAQIRKRKIQNILITIILFLAVFLFSTAISVTNNNEDLYTKIHEELIGAHQILQLENGVYQPEEVHKWWIARRVLSLRHLCLTKQSVSLP